MEISTANTPDLEPILAMLGKAKLPQSGVAELIADFTVVRDGGKVVGAGVIESHGPDGLLRSVVVDPAYRGKGVGQMVVGHLLEVYPGDVYLLTETAAPFFERFGFREVPRDAAPPKLRASEEFRCLCPESASFMRRSQEAANRANLQ